jgi:glycerol-3-phosphate acyltransferase PlsY
MTAALSLILAYLLGSIPFGLILTRLAGTEDIRQIGSGSIGATNVLRTGRKALAAATLLLDAAKGTAAVLLATHLAGPTAGYAAAVVAVAGHMFPVWLGFRGGKGVATGAGVLLAANWMLALVCGAIWLACALALRISSASALAASAAAPLVAAFLGVPMPMLLATALVAALIWLRHKDNIARLLAGTEPRIGRR